jgi:hypothetical protein
MLGRRRGIGALAGKGMKMVTVDEVPWWKKCVGKLWSWKWRLLSAALILVAFDLVASDPKTSEFTVKLAHEVAWPLAVLSLLAYVYRAELQGLIGRICEFELLGIKARGVPRAAERDVERKAESETDQHRKMILQTYLGLSIDALRLLGTVLAVGLSQDLPLGMYRKPAFVEAKQELLDKGLVTRPGGLNYLPTFKGHEVFSEHLAAIRGALGGKAVG